MKRSSKINIAWTSKFAYGIGLLTTDGCLSGDGRHIIFVSAEKEMIENFQTCFGLKEKVGVKSSGFAKEKKCFFVQFSDVRFYRFLLQIGLMPHKSKILGEINVPLAYFYDFLRGHCDGDGTFYSYWDKRWCSSHMFYMIFASASVKHLEWLQRMIFEHTGVTGYISESINESVRQLKYGKKATVDLFRKMYYDDVVLCLSRKKAKIMKAFAVEQEHNNARVAELVDAPA